MAGLVESRNERRAPEDSRLLDLELYFKSNGFSPANAYGFASDITDFFGRGSGIWRVEEEGDNCCVSVGSNSRPEQQPLSITFSEEGHRISLVSGRCKSKIVDQQGELWVVRAMLKDEPTLMIGSYGDRRRIHISKDRKTGLFKIL